MTLNEILDSLVEKCSNIDTYFINDDIIEFQDIYKCHCSNCDGHLCELKISRNIVESFNRTTLFILEEWIEKQEWKNVY
jgi:hypothetical protein